MALQIRRAIPARGGQGRAVEFDRALPRRQEAHHDTREGGLARSAFADDRDGRSARDRQVDILEDRGCAIACRDPLDFQQRRDAFLLRGQGIAAEFANGPEGLGVVLLGIGQHVACGRILDLFAA